MIWAVMVKDWVATVLSALVAIFATGASDWSIKAARWATREARKIKAKEI